MNRRTGLIFVSLVLVASACASGDDGTESSESEPSETEPSETEPDPTAPTTTEAASQDDVEASEVGPADTSDPDQPIEPQTLLQNRPLLPGVSYTTQFIDPEMTITIPEGDGGWSVPFTNNTGFVITLSDVPADQPAPPEPGLQIALVLPGIDEGQVVDTVEAFAAAQEWFEVSSELGQLAGRELTVLRGTSSWSEDELAVIPTSADTEFVLPPSEREFLAYLVEGPAQFVVVVADANPADFDRIVNRSAPVIDSLTFS